MNSRVGPEFDQLPTLIAQSLEEVQATGPLAVGLSAGPDSAALAICADEVCRHIGLDLTLFHVNHGLHHQAMAWQNQSQALADMLKRPLLVRNVTVDRSAGLGIEAAARDARHKALSELASEHRVDALLLAHHMQDQAETVLMRLLRGSGVAGLAAMSRARQVQGVWWLRPWLDVSREVILKLIQAFESQTGWAPVDDPSNRAEDLARGAIRTKVLPALESNWPAWATTLTRHARQAAEASALLKNYGAILLAQVQAPDIEDNQPPALMLGAWRSLGEPEQTLVIRTWLEQAGSKMPSESRLNELLRQLRELHALGHDRAMHWQQKDCSVTCTRGRVQLHVKI